MAPRAANAIPPALLAPPLGPLDGPRMHLPRRPLRHGLLLLAASVCALGAGAIWGSDDAGQPAVLAPPPVVVPPPVAVAPQSVAREGSPVGASVDAGVGASTQALPRPAAPLLAYLSEPVSIGARRALNSVASAIALAPRAFPGFESHCAHITPLLASVPGPVMAGNFRDAGGACYVWVNLATTAGITGADLCKLSLHELGHLGGHSHVADLANVMHSPFVSKPTPAVCAEQPATMRAARKAAG